MNIYFAAPLFAKSDLLYNADLVNQIRSTYPQADIYLPQENASINDKSAYADSKMIAQADTEKVLESDLMIALLDGLTIDPGVASEIGVAFAKEIPVLGLYTDSQQKITALKTVAENQFHYLNLYTVGLIKLNGEIYSSENALLEGLAAYLGEEQ